MNDGVAQFLQGDWQTNLGIHVSILGQTQPPFIGNRLKGDYVMSRDGWQFDYNHPQDWYDNLWGKAVLSANANTTGYDFPTYDSTLAHGGQAPARPGAAVVQPACH